MKIKQTLTKYGSSIAKLLSALPEKDFMKAFRQLEKCRKNRRSVFLCGNGGSAANANHFATDLIYGVGSNGRGLFKVHSLSANSSILTCLGNDTDYSQIFCHQLRALARAEDLLIIFSGSGNSQNVVQVLKTARQMRVKSIAFLGFDGGMCRRLADIVIHFSVHDMQLAEDLHMITAHLLFQHLR